MCVRFELRAAAQQRWYLVSLFVSAWWLAAASALWRWMQQGIECVCHLCFAFTLVNVVQVGAHKANRHGRCTSARHSNAHSDQVAVLLPIGAASALQGHAILFDKRVPAEDWKHPQSCALACRCQPKSMSSAPRFLPALPRPRLVLPR